MSISKVTRNFQITIPAQIRRLMHVEVGSLVDFIVEKGKVILKPKTLVDHDQAWFWTEEWQKDEKEVDRSRKKGETISFRNAKEMRKHFEK